MNTAHPSCPWIQSGLTFGPRSQHVCCVLHHGIRGWPKVADFSGGALDADKIRTTRADIKSALFHGRFVECMGCDQLENKFWNEPKYLIETVNLSHFTSCNLRCNYCYLQRPGLWPEGRGWWNDPAMLEAGKNPVSLVPTFQDMIARNLLSPHAAINWGGGEPTLLPDFKVLLCLLLEHGTRNYIATNGTVFSQALYDALHQSPDQAACITSLDCGTAEMYRRIKGVNLFDRVIQNLRRYAESGGNVEVKYIFTVDNSSSFEVNAFLDHMERINPKTIVCDVDAFDSRLPRVVRRGIASLMSGAMKKGLHAVVAGAGVTAYPEKARSLARQGAFKRLRKLLGV